MSRQSIPIKNGVATSPAARRSSRPTTSPRLGKRSASPPARLVMMIVAMA